MFTRGHHERVAARDGRRSTRDDGGAPRCNTRKTRDDTIRSLHALPAIASRSAFASAGQDTRSGRPPSFLRRGRCVQVLDPGLRNRAVRRHRAPHRVPQTLHRPRASSKTADPQFRRRVDARRRCCGGTFWRSCFLFAAPSRVYARSARALVLRHVTLAFSRRHARALARAAFPSRATSTFSLRPKPSKTRPTDVLCTPLTRRRPRGGRRRVLPVIRHASSCRR